MISHMDIYQTINEIVQEDRRRTGLLYTKKMQG